MALITSLLAGGNSNPAIDLRIVRPMDASLRVVHEQRAPRNLRRGHGHESSEPDVAPQRHVLAIAVAVLDCPNCWPDQMTRAAQEPPSSILGDCRWWRLPRFLPCLRARARMLDDFVPLTIRRVKPQSASRSFRPVVRNSDRFG